MKKILSLCIFLGLICLINAQSISFPFNFSFTLCAGDTGSIPFDAAGTFNSGNIFIAQLSNASGSFSSPTTIGTLTATTSSTIFTTIPISTAQGSAYRIRVISTNPVVIGTDNGMNSTINHPITPTLLATGNGCIGIDSLKVSASSGAAQILWYQDTSLVYHTYPPYTPSTVAGGNGYGSAANQLIYPSGVYLDGNSNIYVADMYNNRIQKFPSGSTSSTNGVTVAGGNGYGSAANQLSNPWGVYVDGSGNIYVADWYNNRIQKFPAGSTSSTNGVTVAGGNGYGSAANQLNSPCGVYVDGSGNIYVADNHNSRIQKFPAGSTSSTNGLTVAGNGYGGGANQLNYPTSVYIDGSGNIYVCDGGNNRIQKFPSGSTSSTNGVTVAGGNVPGNAGNQLNNPWGVYVDVSSNLYVADAGNNRIQKFPSGSTSSTNGVTIAGGNGSGSGANQLNFPSCIYVDGSGNIYIADYGNNRIQKGTPSASTTSGAYSPGNNGSYTTTYITPAGCTSTHSNTVIINPLLFATVTAIASGQTICNGASDTLTAIPSNGGASPAYQWYKNGVAVGTNSSTYITSSLNNNDTIWVLMQSNALCPTPSIAISNRIVVAVNPTLAFAVITSSQTTLCLGAADTFNATPTNGGAAPAFQWYKNGVTAGGNASTYITTSLNNNDSVWVVMTSSAACASPAADTSNHIKVKVNNLPPAPTISASGNACVGNDSLILTGASSAFQINWSQNGQLSNTAFSISDTVTNYGAGYQGQGSSANQLSSPKNSFVDENGYLYVADYGNNRIQKFAPGSAYGTLGVTVAGGNLAGSNANQLNNPAGLFVDGSGYLYVADYNNNRIQKFPPGSTSSTNGITVAGGNGQGNAGNQLYNPFGLYVDVSGNMYVADINNQRIQKFPSGSTSSTNGVTVAGGNGGGTAANQLTYPSGVYVDANGNIYVADTYNSRIQKFPAGSTSSTNGMTVAGGNGYGSATNQLSYPYGVNVDGIGNVYVADFYNNRVQRFPVGSSSSTSGLTVAGLGSGNNSINGATGVFVDWSGNVYGSDQNNYRVGKWAPVMPASSYVPTLAGSYTATYVSWNGCTSPASNAFTFTSPITQSVTVTASQTINCNGAADTFTAHPYGGNAPSYQWYKNSVAVGTNSTTYISTGLNNNDTVWVVMTSTGVPCVSPAAAISSHLAITVIPKPAAQTLSVTGNACIGIDKLTLTGATTAFQMSWYQGGSLINSTSLYSPNTVAGGNGRGNAANQLYYPAGVYVDGSGNIYVADASNNRIQKFPSGSNSSTNGVTVAGGNGAGSAANQLSSPLSVFGDGSGNIYIADLGNNRIQKFPAGSTSSTNGVTVAGGNGGGSSANQLYFPKSAYLDGSGNIYVCDGGNNRIQKFPSGSNSSTNGVTVAGGNGQGNAGNQLYNPWGVYVDASSNLYVADANNNRIQKFPAGSTSSTNGATIAGGNGQGNTGNQLYSPGGIFADGSGNIYIADFGNNRIQKFPLGSTSSTYGVTVAGGGNAVNQLYRPEGVYVDGSGNIYIADYGNHRIQKCSYSAQPSYYMPGVTGSFTASYTLSSVGCASDPSNAITMYNCTVTLSDTVNTISCNGRSDGRVVVAANGGRPPLLYKKGVNGTWQSGNVFTNLSVGVDTFYAKDFYNTTVSIIANITQPAVLSIGGSVTNASPGFNNGAITLHGNGGTPGYLFNWGGNITGSSITNLAAGNYSVTMTDTNGCSATQTYSVITQGITCVSPNHASQGATALAVQICGLNTNFNQGGGNDSVYFKQGTSYIYGYNTVVNSATSLTTNINIPTSANTGLYDVHVNGQGNYFTLSSPFTVTSIDSNLTLYMDTVTGSTGQPVVVRVKVRNFRKVESAQCTIQFDPSVMSFTAVQQFGINSLNASSFGTLNVGSGILSFSWYDPSLVGVTLSDGTVLFAIQFNVITTASLFSPVSFTNSPTQIQFTDTSFTNIGNNVYNGMVQANNLVNVSGKVYSWSGNAGVQNTIISHGSTGDTIVTDTSGRYSFNVPQGSTDTITPRKNNDIVRTNGVTTLDIILIQRHILGNVLLTGPYKLIAADVNSSGSITSLDLLLIRSLILGNITTFTGNKLWAFVPSSYVFSNPQSPWGFPTSRFYTNAANSSAQDFIGVKLGDVTGAWNPVIRQSVDTVNLSVPKLTGAPQTEISIPVRAANFTDISGMQCTIEWDADKLEFSSIDSAQGALAVDYGASRSGEGKLAIVWTDPDYNSTTVPDGSVLFKVKYRITGNAGESSPVKISSAMAVVELVDNSLNTDGYTTLDGEVKIEAATSIQTVSDKQFPIVSMDPNPFSTITNVRFELFSASKVRIEVYDELGQQVEQSEGYYSIGNHKIELGNTWSEGVYFIRLTVGYYIKTFKVINTGK